MSSHREAPEIAKDPVADSTDLYAFVKPNELGVVGGDLAGFPNGRRVFDDVVTIEVRAIAGLTYPLIDKKFRPDGAASLVTDGLTRASVRAPYLSHFPYLGVPYTGFSPTRPDSARQRTDCQEDDVK